MKGQSWSMSRREVLERLGLGLGCLPLLQATRSYAAPPLAPKRFVCVMQPFGYRPTAWLPGIVGPLGPNLLPDSSRPLQPYKDALIFLPGLTNPGLARCAGCDEMAYGTIFSGVGPAGVLNFPRAVTPTVDQLVAAGIAKGAALTMRSLAQGVMVDVGRVRSIAGHRCFWRGDSRPVDPEDSPHALFAWMFGGPASADAARRLQHEKRSLLDYVGQELDRYGARLGQEDRVSVQRHLTSIREIEHGLSTLPLAGSMCAPTLGPPINARRRANFAVVAELQLKLMVAALECDITRVATLQLANALGSGVSLDFIPGVAGRNGAEWAAVAQAPAGASAGVDRKRLADKWFMGLFAKLLGMLSAGPPGATLLDQSVVLWATTMKDGADRNMQSVPWLLAGKCGGYFKTGQVADSAGKPLHGVLAEICNAMDVPTEFFGDRTLGAPMSGLKA